MTAASNDNRAELLDRSLALFADYGYDGVGVQQICEAVGVTKPTLYHHFGNKRGLLQTLMEEQLRGLHAALLQAAAYRGDVALALTDVARATFAFARSHRDFYRLYLTLWFPPMRSEAFEAARRFHERHFEILEALFREAARDQDEWKGRHRALAAAFLGVLNNNIGIALNNYMALNEALARRSVVEFLYGVLPRSD